MQQRQQQELRAGAFRPHGHARMLREHVFHHLELERISRRDQKALLAAAECDQHRVLHVAATLHHRDVCIGFDVVQSVQMHAGGDGLARRETCQARFAADRQRGKAGTAFAQSPV